MIIIRFGSFCFYLADEFLRLVLRCLLGLLVFRLTQLLLVGWSYWMQSREFHNTQSEANKFVREEHRLQESFMRENGAAMAKVNSSLEQVVGALGRINGYKKD